jgi:hypothetical protein
MITVTAAWVDPMRDRPVLESLGLIRPLVPLVAQVHGDLLAKQGISPFTLEAPHPRDPRATADH